MRYLVGVFLILISGSSFGTLAIFARLAYEDGVTPITLLFLRFGIASLFMLSILPIKGIALPRGRTLFGLALMGGIGYVGQALSYFTALTLIPAGLVALLLYLYPAIVTILAVMILKERISKWKVVALLIALGGTVLTIGPTEGGRLLGVIFGLGAAFIYSIYILVGSKITKQVTAMQSSTVVIVSAAIVSGALVAIKGPAFPATASGWASVIAIALISTILAIVTFFAGLERVGATNASTLSTVEPAVTVVLAAMVLGETISFFRIIGGMMIILAVIILARSEAPAQLNSPPPLPTGRQALPPPSETVSQYEKTDFLERGRGGRVGGLPGSGLSNDQPDASQRFRAVTFSRIDPNMPKV